LALDLSKRGLISLHREMEKRPSVQDSNGEAKLSITKGLCRSRRMQGFPLEGCDPLPPNSPEDTYHEEVENHSDVGSDATYFLENPERYLVTVHEVFTLHADPSLEIPHYLVLVRVESSSNIVVEDHPSLPSRPYNQLDMEPIQPTFNKEYATPVRSTEMVYP
jgi:hypothetical protein